MGYVVCNYFLLFHRLSFHFAGSFFNVLKILSDVVPLVYFCFIAFTFYVKSKKLLLRPNLMDLFISSNRFWMESLGFSMYNIMLSGNRDNFTSFFTIYMPFFLPKCSF